MDIKVTTNISNKFKDIEICINAPERNEEVQRLENDLLIKASKNIQSVIGMQNNDIFLINVSDIIVFYGEDKNIFCRTKDGSYRVKEKMYYLEENLPNKDFIRISNRNNKY